jgi:antitoxin (DNA-binding transcriptional repressor) of toxin-antitoxin stability system
MQKEISVAEFVARPMDFLEEVFRTREEIVIVRDGKPIGRLIPIPIPHSTMTLEELRSLGGKVLGDIVEPLEECDKQAPIAERPRKTIEQMRTEGVKILGDIVEPLEDEWDAMK